MRFALLDTKNNAGLIGALGPHCDVIDENKTSANYDANISAELRDKIFAIAERNVTRRKIRFPALFNFTLIAAAYRAVFRRRAIKKFRCFFASLAENTDRVVLVFNGYLAPNALLDLAAQELGLQTLYLENGFFPKTMQCDPKGINALSSLPSAASFYDALSAKETGSEWPSELVVRRSKLDDGDANSSPSDLPSAFIFVPFQVPSDMQILALSPWIKDMVHLHREIVALAAAFPDKHFVIKEHPSFPLSIQSRVEPHAQIHFRNSHVTRDLIERSEAVLTVNSTVGLEALTLNKKIVTLGDAHYAIDGIALTANNRTELHAAMGQLNDWQPNEQRRGRFIRFAFNRFLLPLERTSPGPETFDLLTNRANGVDIYSKKIGMN